MTKPAGRDDIAAALAAGLSMPIEMCQNIVRALFGSGGSGQSGGKRSPGIIENFIDRGTEIQLRGFGNFRRADYSAGVAKVWGETKKRRAKSKISFKASPATDIIK